MLLDLRSYDGPKTLDADVCIIGGGPAGITLARKLARSDRRVVLLEGGGQEAEPDTQALYDGPVTSDADLRTKIHHLAQSRLRVLGGCSHHWWANCHPLDPQDFRTRSWVPHSGWPISFEDVSPHYAEAAAICGVLPFDYDPVPVLGEDALARELQRLTDFAPALFHVGVPPRRFGKEFLTDLEEGPGLRVFIHANVIDLRLAESSRHLERVRASSLEGRRLEVRAKAFILAAGGIENARLLLAANSQVPEGLGNSRGLVGAYFMEHLHLTLGTLALPGPRAVRGLFDRIRRHEDLDAHVLAVLTPTSEFQERERTLNFVGELRARKATAEDREGDLSGPVLSLAEGLRALAAPPPPPGFRLYGLFARAEQAPNPASRVSLVDERDALGMRRARLDWRITDLDRASWTRSIEGLGRELGARAGGRARVRVAPRGWILGGGHHMGTTRMHADPSAGVVDPDCRVHDVDNLWVAGSSVFPAAGAANPTLTLIALALRLASHLEARWSRLS